MWKGKRHEFMLAERSVLEKEERPKKEYEWKLNKKGNISDPRVDLMGLSESEVQRVTNEKGNSARQEFRKARTKPSLTFILIDAVTPSDKELRSGKGTPLLCWVYSIPPTDEKHPTVKYKVAKNWFEHHFAELSDETSG